MQRIESIGEEWKKRNNKKHLAALDIDNDESFDKAFIETRSTIEVERIFWVSLRRRNE